MYLYVNSRDLPENIYSDYAFPIKPNNQLYIIINNYHSVLIINIQNSFFTYYTFLFVFL